MIDAVYMNDRMRIVPFLKVDNQTVRKHFLEYLKDGFEGNVLKNAFSKYEPGKDPASE